MVRKYDKYGLNRQFKSNPCNRRDPFPRDHLPFVDDFSLGKKVRDAVKNDSDKFKEAVRANQKRKREMSRAMRAGEDPLGQNKYKMTKSDKRKLAAGILGSYMLGGAGIIGLEAAVAYNAAFTEATGVGMPTIVGRAAKRAFVEMAEGVGGDFETPGGGFIRRRFLRSGNEF